MIHELLSGAAGAVCSRDADFRDFALEQVRAMLAEGFGKAASEARGTTIKQHIRDACRDSTLQYATLLAMLSESEKRAFR